jgi:hypothetical protein
MTSRDIEQRIIKQNVEVRGSPGSKRIGGYAATFNQRSKLLPGTEATTGGSLGGPFLETGCPLILQAVPKRPLAWRHGFVQSRHQHAARGCAQRYFAVERG